MNILVLPIYTATIMFSEFLLILHRFLFQLNKYMKCDTVNQIAPDNIFLLNIMKILCTSTTQEERCSTKGWRL